MKKFRYSMESILKIKLKLEEQAKLAYANARNHLNAEEEKLKYLRDKKTSYEEEQRILSSNKLNIMKLKGISQSIDIMKLKIEEQKVVVEAAKQRLELARIRLNEAMVERKTQEKLKEKAWQEYMEEFEAEEQKEIDELNSFNYGSAI
ncbi:MAG: flagellar export protein FliJ [Clostridiales bacterium]|nr:flagellar export protein FliJ [Clostridiales bacterium]